jgi:hypothetical protein
MIGCYDFCGHYEWTFAWLAAQGGHELVREYWDTAIHHDSQRHARELILARGFEGMKEYWGHALEQEAAAYHVSATDAVFRIDMHECPSKGFLIRNGLVQYRDYCDHCMGWIGPLMKEAGFVVDHEHSHGGQCWWEIRREDDLTKPGGPGDLSGSDDVRLRADWNRTAPPDVYQRATDPDDKNSPRPRS